MRVRELTEIQREDVAIYYRRTYMAKAIIEIPTLDMEIPISFTIETGPLGDKHLYLDPFKSDEYPVVPIKKALIEYISTMDTEGKLP